MPAKPNATSKGTSTLNPLRALADHGQSIWLDSIRRSLIASGELDRLIDEDDLRGITSNPAIFEKAITGSTDYADAIAQIEAGGEVNATELYEALAVRDIQDAADRMARVYERSARRDGYVSLEVSPYLARDTRGTLSEARRLWAAVGRPNVMIKVPATPEGIPAIEQLVSEGINVNVTLLFAQEAYERVAEAYVAGLEARHRAGGDLAHVASVASFFVSRIDSAVDALLEARVKSASPAERSRLEELAGKVAIANAKLAYQKYKAIVAGPRWKALAAAGAQTQRLLWASTGTKNARLSDVLYVDELIGRDTVNTLPPATLDAFRDHGRPRASLEADVGAAERVMAALPAAGISMSDVTAELLDDGVALFADAFDKLLAAVDRSCKVFSRECLNRQTRALPADLERDVAATLLDWRLTGKVRRLHARDASLWTGADEARWLGWLGVTTGRHAHLQRLTRLAEDARREGLTHALLLGMGGSSLCPEVLAKTFGRIDGFPELVVLDSTDPAQVRAVERRIDPSRTLFIVSSKSGSTLEPNVFKEYFFERASTAVGADRAAARFVAITDPGSQLEKVAAADGFLHTFHGVPSIGGRYSALSDFGMVPATAMGIDVADFLDRTEEMVHACAACVRAEDNPGVALGATLGAAARAGRDKLTLVASPGIADLGAWLEQLIAESTGKRGKGIIPVDREALGAPAVYGADRLFVYLRLETAPDAAQDAALLALERAGQPVVRIGVRDARDLGQEFFRWEIATAVAGAVLGINPFDQPDVEASKIETRRLTDEYERAGRLPDESPIFRGGGIALFTDAKNAAALAAGGARDDLASYVRAHLRRIGSGDYFALLAYVEMNDAHERALQAIRTQVRDATRAATCLGFGPRFLHSTGQAYKGGPDSGVFVQVTCDDAADLPIPGRKFTFGTVKAAQARGDFAVLAERGRRALRVHLGPDVAAGIARLHQAVSEALRS
jgi:transaldolase/glucose-6-phosphate isomerase